MSLCPDNPIRGDHLTDNFTFDEVNKQIVPKPGTDTKPGALALNLGNNLPADATNATDALTAAGFNAMANAVDGTAPLCGNEIQQAVTAAVAQSIACDADAQEAIACAIASNPEAVACLKAALPSGCDDTGTLLLDGRTPSGFKDRLAVYKWEDGVTTQVSAAAVVGYAQGKARYQNPGNFTDIFVDPGASAVGLSGSTYSVGGLSIANGDNGSSTDYILNQSGTRIYIPGLYEYVNKVYAVSASGNSFSLIRSVASENYVWAGDDLLSYQGATLNVVTGATGTVSGPSVDDNPITATGFSHDYSKFASVFANNSSLTVAVRSVSRTGDNLTVSNIGTLDLSGLVATEVTPSIYRASFSWTPDNNQLVVAIAVVANTGAPYSPSGTIGGAERACIVFTVNVTSGGISYDGSGVSIWATSKGLYAPRMSADGEYMIMSSVPYTTAIFKKNDTRWRQIGVASDIASTIVGGLGGYSGRRLG